MANQFITPQRIICGSNALSESKEFIKKLGRKALIVTTNSMIKNKCIEKLESILDSLNIEYAVYCEKSGEPDDIMVKEGLAIFNQQKCDFFIGIGGGSPLDTMKAIAAMTSHSGELSDYMGKSFENPVPPMVAIPSTSGTGTEVTQFTIITDSKTQVKMLLKGSVLMPSIAIVDPAFTMTMPPVVTAATGLDALTHAIEAYTSRKAQPLTDNFAISAIKRIFKFLPKAFKDGSDVTAREQMSLASLEAGIAFNNASVTIVHGMSRPIGALFHVPHGMSNAMLMSECFSFVADGTYSRFGNLGREIGVANKDLSDKEASEKFINAVTQICKTCKVPTIKEYGIDIEKFKESIDKMSSDAMASKSPLNCIKNVTEKDIKEIYKRLCN